MSRIDPVRSSTGFHTASTAMPIADVVGRHLAELVQEPALARAVQPDHGRDLGGVQRPHVPRTWQIENVSTAPVAATSVHPSVGRKHRSQNFRGGTSVRPHESARAWRRCVRHACPRGTRPSLRPRPTRTQRPARRRRRRSRCGTRCVGQRRGPRADRRRAAWRVRGRATGPPVGAHHDDRAHLHQVAPCLRDAALGRAGDLPRAGLAAQLPEELGDLHQAGRGDRVADAEQPAARTARAGRRRAR